MLYARKIVASEQSQVDLVEEGESTESIKGHLGARSEELIASEGNPEYIRWNRPVTLIPNIDLDYHPNLTR